MSRERPRSLPYRPDIDGLRALAILAVLGFHALPEFVSGGFVGVDVFFVISGYLITGIIASRLREGSFSLREFYARRIRRIFPALIVVLVACLVIGWFTLLSGEYAQLGRHVAAASAFVVNLVLSWESGYFDTAAALKPLLHLWSLGVEEQFYIAWPLILWAAWTRRLNVLALTLAIAAMSYWWCIRTTPISPATAFYSPFTRLWQLAIGSLLAFLTSADAGRSELAPPAAKIAAPIGLLLVVVAIGWLDADGFPGWRAILPAAGAGLLVYAGSRSWINRHLLSHPLLVWIGLISYPLYLWHWPLLSFAHIQASTPVAPITRLALIGIAVVLAWLTFEWIERPARRGHGRTVGVLVALMIAVGAAGIYAVTSHGIDRRFPAPIRAYADFTYAPLSDTKQGCWLSATAPSGNYPESCIDVAAPRDPVKPLMLVWGDSHAARLYAGVSKVHGERYRLAQFARDSCPPILEAGSVAECRDGNAFVLRRIEEIRPAVVVLFAYWQYYAREWTPDSRSAQRLMATVTTLTDRGVPKVVVVGPSPKWTKDLPKLLFEASVRDAPLYRVPRRLRVGLDPGYASFESSFRQSLAGRPIAYVSIHDAMCDAQGCLTTVSDGPAGVVSWDYGHLTTAGAAYVAERLLW
jgi:peptidoglycan/LPS O-acetylase OafA/YrhL